MEKSDMTIRFTIQDRVTGQKIQFDRPDNMIGRANARAIIKSASRLAIGGKPLQNIVRRAR